MKKFNKNMQRQAVRKTGTTHSNKHLIAASGVGLMLAVAGSGSVALAVHKSDEAQSKPSSSTSAPKAQIDKRQTSTTPDVSNANSSSTTITVNGQTTHVAGSGVYEKSYTSDDGTTHVDVSVRSSAASNVDTDKEEVIE